MKTSTLLAVFFAAFISVSAQAQIITNYGDTTYPGYGYGGNWDGSGNAVNNANPWAAQTFTAVSSTPIFAYNVQFNVQNGATPSFTTAIYEWTGSGLGSIVANTTATFVFDTNSGFNPYGANVITNPGIGTVSLNAGSIYAIVIQRTDGGATGIVQTGFTSNIDGTPYSGGAAYRSADGSTFSTVGAGDYAFWISFESDILSPTVPEPAVNGAIIGALFVAGVIGWRRYGKNAAASAPTAAV